MNKEQLLDSFIETGTSMERFQELLDSVSKSTHVEKADTSDFQLLSYERIEEEKIYFRLYDHEQSRLKRSPSLASLEVASVQDLCGEAGYEDFIRHIRFLLMLNGKAYIPSNNSFSGIAARAGLSGPAVCDPTHELFALLAKRFYLDPEKAKLVVRKAGNLNKLIACMSNRYAYLPQKAIFEVIENFEKDMNCKPVCKYWEVTQFLTRIDFDFPEKGDDFAKVYNLPVTIVPGITLYTSDAGESSFTARGYYIVDGSKMWCEYYRRKHSGNVNTANIRDKIKNTVFKRYTRLPERLCELITIPVENPKVVAEHIFNQIDFIGAAGKTAGNEIVEELINEYNPAVKYTAYDIAIAIMQIPERYPVEAKSTRGKIEEAVYNAAYADYIAAVRDSSVVLAAA